jgi:citrate lyase subunit beta-like protein
LDLLYARSAVVNAAKAHELQAIDLVCIDYRSEERLHQECLNGKRMGFTGKQAIHPGQLQIINDTFVPSDKGNFKDK